MPANSVEYRFENRVSRTPCECDVTVWQSKGTSLIGNVTDCSPHGIGMIVETHDSIEIGSYTMVKFNGMFVYGRVSNVSLLEDGRYRIGVEVSERLKS